MQRILSAIKHVVIFIDLHLLAPTSQPIRRFLWATFFGVMITSTLIAGMLIKVNAYNITKTTNSDLQKTRKNLQDRINSLKEKSAKE